MLWTRPWIFVNSTLCLIHLTANIAFIIVCAFVARCALESTLVLLKFDRGLNTSDHCYSIQLFFAFVVRCALESTLVFLKLDLVARVSLFSSLRSHCKGNSSVAQWTLQSHLPRPRAADRGRQARTSLPGIFLNKNYEDPTVTQKKSDRLLTECKLVEGEGSPWLESAFGDVSGAEQEKGPSRQNGLTSIRGTKSIPSIDHATLPARSHTTSKMGYVHRPRRWR